MRSICIIDIVNFDGYLFLKMKTLFLPSQAVTFHRDSRNSRASPLLMADFRIE
jgi:hypothetical protein